MIITEVGGWKKGEVGGGGRVLYLVDWSRGSGFQGRANIKRNSYCNESAGEFGGVHALRLLLAPRQPDHQLVHVLLPKDWH